MCISSSLIFLYRRRCIKVTGFGHRFPPFSDNRRGRFDVMSAFLRDPESLNIASSSVEDPKEARSAYFWTRPSVYADEWRTCGIPIPIARFINTLIIVYMTVISMDFIVGLCTKGSRFICTVSLFASVLYWLWATWWDENYAIPPTWTATKLQGFNALWSIIWISFYTLIIGWGSFLAITTVVINYADLREIFKWECWGDNI